MGASVQALQELLTKVQANRSAARASLTHLIFNGVSRAKASLKSSIPAIDFSEAPPASVQPASQDSDLVLEEVVTDQTAVSWPDPFPASHGSIISVKAAGPEVVEQTFEQAITRMLALRPRRDLS